MILKTHNKTILLFTLCLILGSSFSINTVALDSQVGVDEVEQLNVIDQLEKRLSRDIEAYLGHNRFIINVDLLLKRIRTGLSAQPDSSSNQPANNAENQLKAIEELIELIDQKAQLDQQPDSINLPGLPLASDANVTTLKQEQLRKIILEISAAKNRLTQLAPVETAPGGMLETNVEIYSQIENILVTLVIDKNIGEDQELFINNLIVAKLSLDQFRGDQVNIVRSQFNQPEEVSEQLALDEKIEPEPQWQQPNNWVLLAFAVVILIMLWMLFRKNKVTIKNSEQPAPLAPSETVEIKQNWQDQIKDIKQDIITIGLSNPDRTSIRIDELLLDEQHTPMLAACFYTLGSSLFKGLFPSVSHAQLTEINQYLDENQFSYEQIYNHLSSLKVLLEQNNLIDEQNNTSQPFQFLNRLSDNQVIYLLQEESPRVKALTLSQVPALRAANILKMLTPAQQGQVAFEIGQFNSFPVSTFKGVAQKLARKSLNVPSFENINADGTTLLIDMLDNLSQEAEFNLLKQLKRDNPETYFRIRQIYYTFNDLLRTPPEILGEALTHVNRKQLATSLMHAQEELVTHCLSALPAKLRGAIKDELAFTDKKPAQESIEQARKSVVNQIRELIKMGKLNMKDLAILE